MRTDLRHHLALIAELDELFPLKNPEPDAPLDKIRHTSGQRSVVEFLKQELARQEAENENLNVLGDDSHVFRQ